MPSSYVRLKESSSLLDGLETITEYTYRNDKEHINPIQSKVRRNGSVLQTSNFYYPKDLAETDNDLDLNSVLMNDMLARHMVNVLVKSESFGLETKGSKNVFHLFQNRMLPKRTLALERDEWVVQSVLHYHNSDQFPDRYESKYFEDDLQLEWNTPFSDDHGGLLKYQERVDQKTSFFYDNQRYLKKRLELDNRASEYEYDGFRRL